MAGPNLNIAGPFNIGEIFNAYNNKVYRLALSITRNEKDAEDVTQNTFFKVLKNLDSFRRGSQLSTWIYKIAYNEALMNLRRRKSQSRLSTNLMRSREKGVSGLFVNWSKLPDEYLLDEELKERVDGAIRQMPIQYRMALLLHGVEGVPIKETARILGLKTDSLKTRLHRARLLIKSDISDYFRDKEEAQEEAGPKRCVTWTGFIYNYIYGNLGKRRARSFKSHIKDCRSCNAFLGAYQKAIDITHALQCQDLPGELKERIESFLLRKHKNEPFKPPKASKVWKKGGAL